MDLRPVNCVACVMIETISMVELEPVSFALSHDNEPSQGPEGPLRERTYENGNYNKWHC